MIRNSTAAVLGLTVSDVSINFSSFVHKHRFCFRHVRCPTVFASSKHHVLLKFGLQDTLSCKVLEKCATLEQKKSVPQDLLQSGVCSYSAYCDYCVWFLAPNFTWVSNTVLLAFVCFIVHICDCQRQRLGPQ